jgi:signal transduction histidine kinase
MRARALSLLMRPTSPPLALGIVVAVAFIALETLVLYPLREVASEISLGGIYLLGVLVVSAVWGMALGTATAVVSTAVFDFFHVPPEWGFVPTDPQAPVELVILLAVAVLLSSVAELARARAMEADERRREADLASEMARVLLRTEDLRSALPGVSRRLARALGLPVAAIELEPVGGDERRAAFPLSDGATRLGTLVVPAELPRGTEERLRERVVPSVEALLRAARDREEMRSALEASREELRVLAEEQAALRRVATLAARGAPPDEVFAAVTEEVGRLLPVDFAYMGRYGPDGTVTTTASWSRTGRPVPAGRRRVLGGKNIGTLVFETGRPARMDDYSNGSGLLDPDVRRRGVRSRVGTPIVVEGRLWGVMAAGSRVGQPLPADTEARLVDFTELLASAIANAESRAELAASRTRIVAASDETRRRIEHDLHDGAQQRLVSLGLELRDAQAKVPPQLGELEGGLSRVAEGLSSVLEELREIARGIHPAILSQGGLAPAFRALARRSAVPVELDIRAGRLPAHVEVAAYYVVSEALTNTAKHARASMVRVELEAREDTVRLAIHDDGIGGADPGKGSGLVGLSDRIAALAGTLEVNSPAGGGTSLLIEIPLDGEAGAGER